jgi:hypothetical protein
LGFLPEQFGAGVRQKNFEDTPAPAPSDESHRMMPTRSKAARPRSKQLDSAHRRRTRTARSEDVLLLPISEIEYLLLKISGTPNHTSILV